MPLRTPAVRQQRRNQDTVGKAVENSRKVPLMWDGGLLTACAVGGADLRGPVWEIMQKFRQTS